jgi:hypothetical protein
MSRSERGCKQLFNWLAAFEFLNAFERFERFGVDDHASKMSQKPLSGWTVESRRSVARLHRVSSQKIGKIFTASTTLP